MKCFRSWQRPLCSLLIEILLQPMLSYEGHSRSISKNSRRHCLLHTNEDVKHRLPLLLFTCTIGRPSRLWREHGSGQFERRRELLVVVHFAVVPALLPIAIVAIGIRG